MFDSEEQLQRLRELINDPELTGPLRSLLKQVLRLAQSEVKIRRIGEELDITAMLGQLELEDETVRIRAEELSDQMEDLRHQFLECAGASSVIARWFRKAARGETPT